MTFFSLALFRRSLKEEGWGWRGGGVVGRTLMVDCMTELPAIRRYHTREIDVKPDKTKNELPALVLWSGFARWPKLGCGSG